MSDEHKFLLQRVQPMMVGLIDGSLSTLAPIFAVALASHDTRYAFIAGLATSIGAAVSMGFSEALSDTGELTGRGSPWVRGSITGGGTFVGGILHSLPFLISNYHVALSFAIAIVGIELLTLAYLRWKFFSDTFVRSRDVVHKLFAEVAPRFKDRPGGYARIIKIGPRPGDAAEMVYLELVDEEYVATQREERTPERVEAVPVAAVPAEAAEEAPETEAEAVEEPSGSGADEGADDGDHGTADDEVQ